MLVLADVPTFLLLWSTAPPTDTTSSPFFISETLKKIKVKIATHNNRESQCIKEDLKNNYLHTTCYILSLSYCPYSYLKLSPLSASALTENVKK
jgi:hypothetical protein